MRVTDIRDGLREIVRELEPEFHQAVAQLGAEQVRQNIMDGLRRMHERAKADGRVSGAALAAAEFGIDLDAHA